MTNTKKKALGSRLRTARKSARLSQQDVAGEMGCTRQAVASWERGASVPNALQLAELATIYGCWADILLFGSRQERPATIDWENLQPAVKARLDVLWQLFGRQDAVPDVPRLDERSLT